MLRTYDHFFQNPILRSGWWIPPFKRADVKVPFMAAAEVVAIVWHYNNEHEMDQNQRAQIEGSSHRFLRSWSPEKPPNQAPHLMDFFLGLVFATLSDDSLVEWLEDSLYLNYYAPHLKDFSRALVFATMNGLRPEVCDDPWDEVDEWERNRLDKLVKERLEADFVSFTKRPSVGTWLCCAPKKKVDSQVTDLLNVSVLEIEWSKEAVDSSDKGFDEPLVKEFDIEEPVFTKRPSVGTWLSIPPKKKVQIPDSAIFSSGNVPSSAPGTPTEVPEGLHANIGASDDAEDVWAWLAPLFSHINLGSVFGSCLLRR